MSQSFALNLNGASRNVTVESGTPLLYVLRNDLELNRHVVVLVEAVTSAGSYIGHHPAQ